ncbi:Dual specificity tyrosine-phosphorylation-regulated kinase [Chytriomyces hyalinus]|nr:Dual specificity tyrosine-phosphorylation-regulated kinase [Chytriomyces hyalinus]
MDSADAAVAMLSTKNEPSPTGFEPAERMQTSIDMDSIAVAAEEHLISAARRKSKLPLPTSTPITSLSAVKVSSFGLLESSPSNSSPASVSSDMDSLSLSPKLQKTVAFTTISNPSQSSDKKKPKPSSAPAQTTSAPVIHHTRASHLRSKSFSDAKPRADTARSVASKSSQATLKKSPAVSAVSKSTTPNSTPTSPKSASKTGLVPAKISSGGSAASRHSRGFSDASSTNTATASSSPKSKNSSNQPVLELKKSAKVAAARGPMSAPPTQPIHPFTKVGSSSSIASQTSSSKSESSSSLKSTAAKRTSGTKSSTSSSASSSLLASTLTQQKPAVAPTTPSKQLPSTPVVASIPPSHPPPPPPKLSAVAPSQSPVPAPPTPSKPLPPASSLTLPLTPEVTLHYFRALLTPYEQQEVQSYNEIWFAGSSGVQKIGTPTRRTGADGVGLNIPGTGDASSATADDDGAASRSNSRLDAVYNDGYDDSRGDLYLTHHDHIAYRYEMISLLGKGSFGQCVKCFDHKLKKHVAVKVIRNKKRFEKQGLIEVRVLDRLKAEDKDSSHNVVYMNESFTFRNHLCISFEILGVNLYEWVKAGGYRGIHTGVIQRFSHQILKSLQLFTNIGIVHCDLKPENILLKDTLFQQPGRCDFVASSSATSSLTSSFIPPDFNMHANHYALKVIDLGSSCYETEKVYTYVQSRFYRSPEVILGISYTVGIDMWSFGCILAELYTGYPLFPGENEQEQLACIMEVLGTPPPHLLDRGTRSKLFFEMSGTYTPRIVPNSKGRKRRPNTKTLGSALRCGDEVFIDFLKGCLEWCPERRFTPQDALAHAFMRPFWPEGGPIVRPGGSARDGRKLFSGDKNSASMSSVNGSGGPVLLATGRMATTSSVHGRLPATNRGSFGTGGAGLPIVDSSAKSSSTRVSTAGSTSSGGYQSSPALQKKTVYRASIAGTNANSATVGGAMLPPISGGNHHVTTRVSMYGGLVGGGNSSGSSASSGLNHASVTKRQSLGANLSRSYTLGGGGGRVGAPSNNPWK